MRDLRTRQQATEDERDVAVREVRRLRALLKKAEWASDSKLVEGDEICPWCGAVGFTAHESPMHEIDCMAFTPQGVPR